MKKIILASTSPRRKELLNQLGIKFEIISPLFDENLINKDFSYEKIEYIAEEKCNSIKGIINGNAIIISADTVVILDNIVMGKPKDKKEAFNMLSKLRGKTHKVVTAVCVENTEKNKKIIKSETSEVTFNEITDEEIISYIDNFNPLDKAGSYGIQELPDNFIKNIKGEFDNIVGLPTKMLTKMIMDVTNPD